MPYCVLYGEGMASTMGQSVGWTMTHTVVNRGIPWVHPCSIDELWHGSFHGGCTWSVVPWLTMVYSMVGHPWVGPLTGPWAVQVICEIIVIKGSCEVYRKNNHFGTHYYAGISVKHTISKRYELRPIRPAFMYYCPVSYLTWCTVLL